MKTPFQLRAEMESIVRWNEFARPTLKGKDEFMVARAGHFTIQIHVICAGRAGSATRHPAEMEIASQNGIFISTQSWNENSIKIVVPQRDHFPFHLFKGFRWASSGLEGSFHIFLWLNFNKTSKLKDTTILRLEFGFISGGGHSSFHTKRQHKVQPSYYIMFKNWSDLTLLHHHQ